MANQADTPGSTASIEDLRKRIRDRKNSWDQHAMTEQKKALNFGKYSALLIPAAVLILSFQILACAILGCSRTLAALLIGLELVVLLVALLIVFLDLGPRSHTWANDRMRTEVLRREEMLLVTRIGPYLTLSTASALANAVAHRLKLIEDEQTEPIELIPLQNSPGAAWRDQLEDAQPVGWAAPEPNALQEYLESRSVDQQEWFFDRQKKLAEKERRMDFVTGTALVLALLVAAAHLTLLLKPAGGQAFQTIIEVLAIVLPPVSAAVSSIQTFLQYRRLSHSYGHHSNALKQLNAEFDRLSGGLQGTVFSEAPRACLEFKRLVLRAEELLAGELRQWYFVMRPDKPPVH